MLYPTDKWFTLKSLVNLIKTHSPYYKIVKGKNSWKKIFVHTHYERSKTAQSKLHCSNNVKIKLLWEVLFVRFLIHITSVYGKSNVALLWPQQQSGRRTSIKVIAIFTAKGKERWQSHAMVLKAPDRKTEGIFSTILHALKQVT